KVRLRPNELSGGEKQRVAIGRALVKNPTFTFADEPTAALDWSQGQLVMELLRIGAHDRGATILVVGHDARMVPYADRVLYLEDGSLRERQAMTIGPLPWTVPMSRKESIPPDCQPIKTIRLD